MPQYRGNCAWCGCGKSHPNFAHRRTGRPIPRDTILALGFTAVQLPYETRANNRLCDRCSRIMRTDERLPRIPTREREATSSSVASGLNALLAAALQQQQPHPFPVPLQPSPRALSPSDIRMIDQPPTDSLVVHDSLVPPPPPALLPRLPSLSLPPLLPPPPPPAPSEPAPVLLSPAAAVLPPLLAPSWWQQHGERSDPEARALLLGESGFVPSLCA